MKADGRRLSREELRARRQQVIDFHRQGMPVMEIVAAVGLSWPTVHAVVARYEADGKPVAMPEKRGRKRGWGRFLTTEQEADLKEVIYRKLPWQLGFREGSRKLSLWDIDVVKELIVQRCSLQLSKRCVGKYLERWGLPPIEQHRRRIEECTPFIQEWLSNNNLEKICVAKRADLYWLQRKSVVRSDGGGELPKLATVISIVSKKGKREWRFFIGNLTQQREIQFLKALVGQARRPLVLVRPDAQCLMKTEVQRWLEENGERITIIPPLLEKERAIGEKRRAAKRLDEKLQKERDSYNRNTDDD